MTADGLSAGLDRVRFVWGALDRGWRATLVALLVAAISVLVGQIPW